MSLPDRLYAVNRIFEDTVTIAAAGSLSGSLQVGNTSLVGIYTPATWTASDITLQVSHDGVTWYEMKDYNGGFYTVSAITGGGYRPLPPADFVGPKYIKVRSGTLAAPVVQAAQRVLRIVLRDI